MLNDGSNPPGSEGDARKLVVAMALLTREFERGRAAAMFANRERGQTATPEWATLAAAALAGGGQRSGGPPAPPGPSQEKANTQPVEVVIVGQRATVAVHDVGATRFGREERREQDKQFRAALFGGPTKIPGAATAKRAEGKAGAAAGDAVSKALVSKFALIFGPLIALTTVLNQANSGFGVFQKTLQVFAASLAPILLPVFVLLGAAVLTVSDKIFQELLPKLDDWYKWILGKGIPALEAFAKSIGRAAGALVRWAERLGVIDKEEKKPGEEEKSAEEKRMQMYEDLDPFGIGKGIPKFMDRHFGERYEEGPSGTPNPDIKKYGGARPEDFGIGKPEPFVPPILRGIIGPPESKSAGGLLPKSPDVGDAILNRLGQAKSETSSSGSGVGGLMAEFRGNMDLMMKSLQQSILPKPSYQALTEIGKSMNLAAVGQDPIDMKLMQMTIISFQKLLEAIAKNTEQKQEPTFKGDF